MINHHMIGYYFLKGFIFHNHVAKDTDKNRHLLENIQFNIRKYVPSSNTNNLYPFKKLYKGMKVMFTKILYRKIGLINGTIYIVHEIVIDNSTNLKTFNFHKPFLYILVDFNTFINNHYNFKNIYIHGYSKNIIPIVPIFSNFYLSI